MAFTITFIIFKTPTRVRISPLGKSWHCTLGKSLYKFPGNETRQELLTTQTLESDWRIPCKSGVWSGVWRGKFATSVETLPDLISKGLHKADKDKKVEFKPTETAEEDKTLPPSNTRNSKSAAVGSMSLLQKFEIYQRSTFFVKGLCFRRPRILSYAFSTIIYHSAVTVRSLTRCPGMVHFIHAAIYDLATETCGKTHFKVDLSFPGGTSQVCTGGMLAGVLATRVVYQLDL